MKETFVKQLREVQLENPILIEGLPGLGLVGKIATRYLIKQLKAQKFAKMYSPHFPYYVLVNKKGNVRLLQASFYYWKNPDGQKDLMFFTGDSQAQTIEGQYEISNKIIEFAKKQGVKTIITLGGYRKEVETKPKVIAAATDPDLLQKALKANATLSPTGSPIVGTAGLILGLARFQKISALCLLGETKGYLPDPKAAKSVLEVLQKILNISIDYAGLDKQIAKAEKIVEKIRKIEEERVKRIEKVRKEGKDRITYIS